MIVYRISMTKGSYMETFEFIDLLATNLDTRLKDS
jgi:hypothetical protein